MKISTLIIIALIIISCSSDDNQNNFNISNGIEFSIKNSNGKDMLNTETPNHLVADEIKLYYLKDNKLIEIFDANLDSPRHYFIYKNTISGDYRITINPHIPEGRKNSITIIKWRENSIDTLKTEHSFHKDAIILEKAYLNDELIWDAKTGRESYHEIILQ